MQRYERELFKAGRYLEFVQLGIARYVLTAPIDFVERAEALRAACPEIDRQRGRGELRAKLAEWRSRTEGR